MRLEELEGRVVPAVVSLTNGLLSVVGNDGGSVVQVSQQGATVRVSADNVITLFPAAAVTSISLVGGRNGFNDLTNLAPINSTIVGGDFGNTLQAFGGNDTIFGGLGSDTIYDILGTNVVNSQRGTAKDTLFVNAASTTLSKANDQVVSFFGAGRTPGSNSIQLINGVLYLTPDNDGSTTTVTPAGGMLVVAMDARTMLFPINAVQYIGYFGGQGNDTYVNGSTVPEVAYGGLGGNDTLVGNVGFTSFMKGGGGNDVIVGRSLSNDLSGNDGNDVLYAVNGSTVFRTDGNDFLTPRNGDRVVF